MKRQLQQKDYCADLQNFYGSLVAEKKAGKLDSGFDRSMDAFLLELRQLIEKNRHVELARAA